MIFPNTVDRLLNTACPSIRYRIRKELLNEPPQSAKMRELQRLILDDGGVRDVFNLQHKDGWLGGSFHGCNEPESGIRYLCEKGVDGSNTVIRNALRALEERGDAFDSGCLSRVGKALDSAHLGGSNMIKACVFAYASCEDRPFISQQILEALRGFEYVLSVGSINDVCSVYRDRKYVFNDGVAWPGIYHLRLLAYTHGWRTAENLDNIPQSLGRLAGLSPIPKINLLHKGQVMSPASAFMDDFSPDMENLDAKGWMMWLYRTELISRLGVIPKTPGIASQVRFLYGYLDSNGGLFPKTPSHYYFTKWTPYLGLALENDWSVRENRRNDLTFRSLIILNRSGLDFA